MNLENNEAPGAANVGGQEQITFTNQTTTEAAGASSVKKPKKPPREKGSGKTGRTNRTPEETTRIRQALIALVHSYGKATSVRHIFYLAVTAAIGEKTKEFYQLIIKLMTEARRTGELGFEWIVDNTRRVRTPLTFTGIPQALEWLVYQYKLSYWDQPEADCQVLIWCEAATVSHIIEEVTFHKYAVPYYCARGASSITFIHEAAEEIEADGRPAFVYWFGDWDKSGLDIFETFKADLLEWTPTTDVTVIRMAVTAEQIVEYGLVTHEAKESKDWIGDACELDAMDTRDLQNLVECAIVQHIDGAAWNAMKTREENEKIALRNFAAKFGGAN
jgi:hypothetical protein